MDGDEQQAGGGRKRAGIQSVEIGLGVLDALSRLGRAVPLAAVTRACGLSPSQTHRYLASLAEGGMVTQDARGLYDLGPAAVRLGLSALARIDVYRLADTALSAFSRDSGATCQLAALGPMGPTIIRWYAGRPPIVTSLSVGSVLSLPRSSTGQAFMAFRPPHETRDLAVADVGEAAVDALAPVIAQARAQGFAQVSGTVIPGLAARAYPVFDSQGHAALVASIVWPAGDAAPPAVAAMRALVDGINAEATGGVIA